VFQVQVEAKVELQVVLFVAQTALAAVLVAAEDSIVLAQGAAAQVSLV
jgi:hypothetical protein